MSRLNNPRYQIAWLPWILLLGAMTVQAQEAPAILNIEVDNWVIYIRDTEDFSKLAKTPTIVQATFPSNFVTNVGFADIVSINGKPFTGTMVMQNQMLALRPNAAPGRAIGDVTRTTRVEVQFDFMTTDSKQFGSIYGTGLAGGNAIPGSVPGTLHGSTAVIGGAGAYVGVRGLVNNTMQSGVRNASMAEDPAMRRINGGGKGSFVVQIWPMIRPEVAVTAEGPVVLHADFSPVNANRPAQRGEILIIYSTGLGPAIPAANPGEPFPDEPLANATSPIEVLVGGKSTPAINQVGVPGSVGVFRIDAKVPADVTPGVVTLQLSAACVTGAAVQIPVR